MQSIKSANIDWQTDHLGNTVPVSGDFDDIYFSHAGGLDESHYVFIEGNDLTNRLENLNNNDNFIVAETGFGTGLNFLALCRLWHQLKLQGSLAASARLQFISTEKFPLTKDDLSQALSTWQDDELSPFVQSLIEQYPLPLEGCHRLYVRQDVVLDLWLGDALASFEKIHQTRLAQNTAPKVNAWFLDGFAPSKNSELWSDELFRIIKKLSAENATLATFTAAGFVRRGLQDVGFTMSKKAGFGCKREMLVGKLTNNKHDDNTLCNDIINTKSTQIAIIGAGVAGLCVAQALANRGVRVVLLDKNAPLSGASGNPRAMFAPKLSLFEQAADHLSTVSFLFAERFYQHLNRLTSVFSPLGVVDFLLPTQKSHDKLRSLIRPYPDELIHEIDPIYPNQTIHTLVPKAGLICPKALSQAIQSNPLITHQKFLVQCIEQRDDGVILHGDGESLHADEVVITAGFESHLLHDKLFNPRKIRGQVSWLSVDEETFLKLPNQPIKYDGYCAKFQDGKNKQFLLGASFVRNCTETDIKADEHQFNIDKLSQSLPSLADALDFSDVQGRASIRAQTPDYHPIVGRIDDRIHVLYGMGSKGFTFAPLCAEILAGLIFDEILPVSGSLLAKLSPSRTRLATPLAENV